MGRAPFWRKRFGCNFARLHLLLTAKEYRPVILGDIWSSIMRAFSFRSSLMIYRDESFRHASSPHRRFTFSHAYCRLIDILKCLLISQMQFLSFKIAPPASYSMPHRYHFYMVPITHIWLPFYSGISFSKITPAPPGFGALIFSVDIDCPLATALSLKRASSMTARRWFLQYYYWCDGGRRKSDARPPRADLKMRYKVASEYRISRMPPHLLKVTRNGTAAALLSAL